MTVNPMTQLWVKENNALATFKQKIVLRSLYLSSKNVCISAVFLSLCVSFWYRISTNNSICVNFHKDEKSGHLKPHWKCIIYISVYSVCTISFVLLFARFHLCIESLSSIWLFRIRGAVKYLSTGSSLWNTRTLIL